MSRCPGHLPILFLASIAVACSDGGGVDDPDAAQSTPDAAGSADPVDAAAPVVRILPLGDSLTLGYGTAAEGAGSEAGYRLRLSELLTGAGVSFDFVGSQTNGPASLTDKHHEGYNGYAVAQVAEMAGPALAAYEPDIVLLLAGTNDQITFVPPSQPPAGAAADMEALIEQLDTTAPGIQIVLAKVIPLTHNDEGVQEYNALLGPLVDRQLAAGVNIQLVDMYTIGTEQLAGDGIHPTQAGYDMMAEIWFPALSTAIDELD